MGDSHMGLHARLMSQALRKLAGAINKSGSWYSYEGNRIGQGRENLKEYLSSNPVLLNEIELKIREKFKSGEIEQVAEEIDISEIENAEN